MALYNTPLLLVKRAIESVLLQDFKHFELIIVDDGSDADISSEIVN